MTVTRAQLDTIARIYDVVLEPNQWSGVLGETAAHAGALMANLSVIDANNPECHTHATNIEWPPQATAFYRQTIAPSEAEHWLALRSFPTHSVISDTEFFADRSLYDGLPLVRWARGEFGVYHRAVSCLNLEQAWVDGIALQYSEERGPITAVEKANLKLLLPHLAKAVSISRPFRVLEARFRATCEVLDRYHVAVLIVRDRGEVIVQNEAATRILEEADGLELDPHGRLRAQDPEQHRPLLDTVRQCIETTEARAQTRGTEFTVPRSRGRSALLVEVSPLRDGKGELDRHLRAALVCLIDPDRPDKISSHGMQELFHLTNAEAEVCRLLTEGHSAELIREQRGVSPNTLKTQLKALFTKTRCQNRAQLIRLALKVNIPIDR